MKTTKNCSISGLWILRLANRLQKKSRSQYCDILESLDVIAVLSFTQFIGVDRFRHQGNTQKPTGLARWKTQQKPASNLIQF